MNTVNTGQPSGLTDTLDRLNAPGDIIQQSAAASLGSADFLRLMTAQLANQDPLEPVDSTQFVEQLATFSNLELQAKNNQILEGIADMLQQYVAPSGAGSSAPVPAANPENLI